MKCLSGIKITIGSDTAPEWTRLDPNTQAIYPKLFLPLSGIPTTYAPNRPREASPTGKSRMGIATYSIARQPLELAITKTTIMTDPDPIYAGEGRLLTSGVIDPYASQIRDVRQPAWGKKWFG